MRIHVSKDFTETVATDPSATCPTGQLESFGPAQPESYGPALPDRSDECGWHSTTHCAGTGRSSVPDGVLNLAQPIARKVLQGTRAS